MVAIPREFLNKLYYDSPGLDASGRNKQVAAPNKVAVRTGSTVCQLSTDITSFTFPANSREKARSKKSRLLSAKKRFV